MRVSDRKTRAIDGTIILVLGIVLSSYAASQVWLNRQPQKDTLSELSRSLALDPASAYKWANLADAEMNASNVNMAGYCFQQAVKAGPNDPVILFRAANFAFQTGDPQTTLLHLRMILQDPELTNYYEPAFLTYTRLGLPIQQILDQGIPKTRTAAYAFLRFLMEGNQLVESAAAWDWIQQSLGADDKLAGEYVAFLIRENAPQQAALVWQKLTVRDFPDYRNTNWVFDGRFEQEPKPSPLDWRLETTASVPVTRAEKAGHAGGWALKVKFPGDQNVDFKQIQQTIVLGPGRWSLRAWVKTEGITTDCGVLLHLFDSVDRQRLDVRSDNMIGTNNWTLIEKNFEIDTTARVATLEFVREPSRKFDNKIAGTAWLDSVEIRPSR
jgi:tetratricopeptide (TPR) repeat protein